MKMREVQKIAKQHGINSFGRSKKDLILAIQGAEGNFQCFGTAIDFCDQYGCCFRSQCLNGNQSKSTRKKITARSGGVHDYYNTKYLLAGMHSM
jgi:hypothetical protein